MKKRYLLIIFLVGTIMQINICKAQGDRNFKSHLKEAEKGDVHNQILVGECYEYEMNGVKKDLVEALKWYRKAADQGDASAQLMVGDYYELGKGVNKDTTEAIKWYRKVVDHGGTNMNTAQAGLDRIKKQTEVAREVTAHPDRSKNTGDATFKVFLPQAEKGDATSQLIVAHCYETGTCGVTKDFKEALKWYQLADVYSQQKLGIYYEFGLGVKQDMSEAKKCYQKSVDLSKNSGVNDVVSQDGLDRLALRSNTKDSVQNVVYEKLNVDSLCFRSWLKAAEKGSAVYQYMVGQYYLYGASHGITPDAKEGMKWFRKAADQGNANAQIFIAMGYEFGMYGVKKDTAEAIKWYRMVEAQESAQKAGAIAGLKRLGQEPITNPNPPVQNNSNVSAQNNQEQSTYRGSGDPLKGLNVSKAKDISSGKYYALIIGIDKYSGQWHVLNTAVRDAKSLEKTLSEKYKIDKFYTLYDGAATRTAIMNAFDNLVNTMKEDDNVIIYFSGHGDFKKTRNIGYWIPVDAKTDASGDLISNNDIQNSLASIKSKHTLLISDACFSGGIFRGNTVTVPFEESDKYYTKVYNLLSRQALTSGGMEPVMDGGKDGHSVFSYYLLKSLENNTNKYFDIGQLYNSLKVPVVNNSNQTPQLDPIQSTGDEGGQFLFIKK